MLMTDDRRSRQAWAERQHAVYGDEVPNNLLSDGVRDYATQDEWDDAVQELRDVWRQKGKEMARLRQTHPEAIRLAAGHSIGRYEAWMASPKEDQEAYSAYLRLQRDRQHLNATYRVARGEELAGYAQTFDALYTPPLMAAIVDRRHQAYLAALGAWYAATRAARAKRPIDDAAWRQELERRRHDDYWRGDREWQIHPDNPDTGVP
jgi:hypothetical protein